MSDGRSRIEEHERWDQLFRILADAAPVMIWMSGTDKLCTYFNRRWLDFTGRSLREELGDGWTRGVHPDDMKAVLQQYSAKFGLRQEFTIEYRLRRCDGEYRWIMNTGAPRFSPDGSCCGYIGSCFDITEGKQAAASLSDITARLVEAQEKERARIARELHDDIGGSLAVLGVEILRAGKPVSGSPGKTYPGLPEVYDSMQEIAKRVSRLSHQLHSPALQYIGLAEAIRIECREFSEHGRIPVACSCRDVPRKLDPSVALGLFRVVQEALENSGRHSGADRIWVELTGSSAMLTLSVRDNGRGFDPNRSALPRGLGLITMGARIRMCGGEFAVRSEPGRGVEINCRVPLTGIKPETM
jgi:PAS domain S-box-containing protein